MPNLLMRRVANPYDHYSRGNAKVEPIFLFPLLALNHSDENIQFDRTHLSLCESWQKRFDFHPHFR
ncbi:hypothetical protein [Candidatus Electronema sp. JC]|uniref:hypothetical protein n=1 Tax=Candidatus Electronema sp. JC TaxID=3401570 RepID=UPI003B43B50F